jgi:hypothetical protein
MTVFNPIIPALFLLFLAATIVFVRLMLIRKATGRMLLVYRFGFFFLGCLMLICLVPLWLSQLLNSVTVLTNLAVVVANAVGYVLSLNRRWGGAFGEEPDDQPRRLRSYQVYFRGQPFAVITKDGFNQLMELKLLKRQRTLELVDDYQQQARKQGAQVLLLTNDDGSKKLLKVEGPETDS